MTERLNIKVRYNEVDSMKYVYHANYATYIHLCRTELLRKINLDDKSMEMKDIIFPVVDIDMKYLKPAVYDETIVVETKINSVSACRIRFCHEIFNQNNELINKSKTTIAYVNNCTRKAIAIPEEIREKIISLID